MTATKDAITASTSGVALQFVAVIEGYDYILTDGDPDVAFGTWDGESSSAWAGALGGMTIDWSGMKQSIAPWQTRIDPMSITLQVMDATGEDLFGIATHAKGLGNETKLDGDLNTTDTTVTVKSNSGFASAGALYVGQECIEYAAKGGSASFTGCARGVRAPFGVTDPSTMEWARNHAIPRTLNTSEVKAPPTVSSTPREWIGKWVGVWMHTRQSGTGTLNSKADAQLVFAGTIASISDTSSGVTLVECVDLRQRIQECMLLRDQLVGTLAEGVSLRAGMQLQARDDSAGTGKSTTFTVKTSPSTNYEAAPGVYTLSEFENIVNLWFQQAKADANLNFDWTYQAQATTNDGLRGKFSFEASSSSAAKRTTFYAPAYVLKVMGFVGYAYVDSYNSTSATWSVTSAEEPYKLLIEHGPNIVSTVSLTHTSGTWIDNTDTLPAALRPWPSTATSQWGLLKLSTGTVALAHYESATSFSLYIAPTFDTLGNNDQAGFAAIRDGLRVSDAGDITVSQVVMMEGAFTDLLTRILVSTGVNGYNGTSDNLAEQLGCAIPYELLSTAWEESVAQLASPQTEAICIFLDKPRKLWDVLKTQLILRRASLVWRDEYLRAVTWSTPTATTATWDLTESNKFAPAGTVDPQRSPSITSDEYQINTVKIEFNRDLTNNYRDSITVMDRSAVSDGERPVTIQEPSSFAGVAASGQSVYALAAEVAAWLPLFSRPIRKVRRSIGIEHICTMAPGDQAFVTDNFTRDPTTGARGLTAVPALIVSVHWDVGGFNADGSVRDFISEIDLVLEPGTRFAPYSPCCEVDYSATSAGYVAGTKTLTVLAHAHSESTASNDLTHFDVGDKVTIIEIDPATAASPLTWNDTIATKPTSTTLTLTTGIAGWDTTKRYRMVSRDYSNATSTQKSDVYQADDASGLIASSAQAYRYTFGASGAATWTATTLSQPVSLLSTSAYGDGIPLDTGYERDMVELANNLQSYRTAPISPVLNTSTIVASSGTYQRQLLHIMPWYIGPGNFYARTRLIHLAPFARNTQASGKSIWVYWCRTPPTGTSLIWTTATAPEYTIPPPYETVTFSLGASAGWAALTAQTLDCRAADPSTGMGWLVMEGEKGIETRGYATLYLGPVQDP